MLCSAEVDQVAAAIHAAQQAMPAIHKTADNPFFKSRYAPLGDVMEAALRACNAVGLSVQQGVVDGNRAGFTLETVLMHTSGQWISNGLWFPCPEEMRKGKDGSVSYGPPTPQGVGSAVTYARRYSLSAALGIVADDDDDAESTVGRGSEHRAVSGADKPMSTVIPPLTQAIDRLARVPAPKIEPPKGPGSVGGIPNSCPKCGGKVWSNLEKKASGEYKETSPDWSCADKTCKTGKFRTAGWLDKDPDPIATPVHVGPGAPGSDFATLPEALRDQDDFEFIP